MEPLIVYRLIAKVDDPRVALRIVHAEKMQGHEAAIFHDGQQVYPPKAPVMAQAVSA